MGRIRSKLVKRVTRDILKQAEFTEDFEKNKQIMAETVQTNSKKFRNIIAGYAAKLTKRTKL